MDNKLLGLDIISLGHLIKREKDRFDDSRKKTVFGDNQALMCSDLSIVRYLANNTDREIYQKDIESTFSLTAPSVSNKLKTLEKHGLIQRVYSKVDTRLKQVIITDLAKEVNSKMQAEVEIFESRLKKNLNDDELETLFTLLSKVKNVFE